MRRCTGPYIDPPVPHKVCQKRKSRDGPECEGRRLTRKLTRIQQRRRVLGRASDRRPAASESHTVDIEFGGSVLVHGDRRLAAYEPAGLAGLAGLRRLAGEAREASLRDSLQAWL